MTSSREASNEGRRRRDFCLHFVHTFLFYIKILQSLFSFWKMQKHVQHKWQDGPMSTNTIGRRNKEDSSSTSCVWQLSIKWKTKGNICIYGNKDEILLERDRLVSFWMKKKENLQNRFEESLCVCVCTYVRAFWSRRSARGCKCRL